MKRKPRRTAKPRTKPKPTKSKPKSNKPKSKPKPTTKSEPQSPVEEAPKPGMSATGSPLPPWFARRQRYFAERQRQMDALWRQSLR